MPRDHRLRSKSKISSYGSRGLSHCSSYMTAGDRPLRIRTSIWPLYYLLDLKLSHSCDGSYRASNPLCAGGSANSSFRRMPGTKLSRRFRANVKRFFAFCPNAWPFSVSASDDLDRQKRRRHALPISQRQHHQYAQNSLCCFMSEILHLRTYSCRCPTWVDVQDQTSEMDSG